MTLLEIAAPPKQRTPAFAGSVGIHCILMFALAMSSGTELSRPVAPVVTRKYSVRFLKLQMPRETSRAGSSAGAASLPALAARGSRARQTGTFPATNKSEGAEKRVRPFELPQVVQARPAKQTLVQLDRPPNLPLKQDIPLPAMLLWTDSPKLPEMRKQFVAPPVKKVQKVVQSLPVAPVIEVGNRETTIADLKIAAALPVELARLVQPKSTTAPVRIPGPPPVKIPDIVPPEITQPSQAAIISLPDAALRLTEITVLPPANQIAPPNPSGSGGSGQGEPSNGSGSGVTQGIGKTGTAGGSDGRSEGSGTQIAGVA